MIQKETYLSGVDNSGVISMKCIHIHGGFKQKTAKISQLVTISCRKVKPKKKKRPFRKGDIVKGVVICSNNFIKGPDHSRVRFLYNAVIPFQRKAQQEWLGPKLGGTRLKSPIGFSPNYEKIHAETKKKIFSLANKIIR